MDIKNTLNVRAVRAGEYGAIDNITLWPVPDTGQTTCYNATDVITCPQPGQSFYRQDAGYSINTPAYTKLAASCTALADTAATWAMVRDDVTGLVWEEKHAKDSAQNYTDPNDADNTYTWYDNDSATNGGNAGTQTMAVAVRAIATNELTRSNTWRTILREIRVAILNGLTVALVMGVGVAFFLSNMQLGGVIAAAMLTNIVIAGLAGVFVPVLLDRMDVDPAVASSIFVTMITDSMGFLAFLGLAAATGLVG